MTWRDQAACQGMDSRIFFPERGRAPKEARSVCGECPVTQECAEYAVTHNMPVRYDRGIWGDTNERERRLLRKALHARL